MNRRAFAKALAMWAGGLLLWPKGGDVAQIGDLFAKLGGGETLTRGEIETLRLEMNRIQSGVSRLDTIMGPTGGLDPNVFRNNSNFSVLPGEMASFSSGTAQSIADGVATALVFPTVSGAMSWKFGLRRDETNDDKIYVSGVPGETVYHISGFVGFASNATGYRAVFFKNASGSANNTLACIPAANGQVTVVPYSFYRTLKIGDDYVQLFATQTSGGALDVSFATFAVVRVR